MDARIYELAANQRLTGDQKRKRIFKYLAEMPDLGIEVATESLITTEDRRIAEYMAQYMEVVPEAGEEKNRAAERLRQHSVLVRSAARLVPWLSGDLLEGFITDYLNAEDSRAPVSNVLYTMGIYTPERLRPIKNNIKNENIHDALLSGAPPEMVDFLAGEWQKEHKFSSLTKLALVRTPYALERIISLRETVGNTSDWEMLVELAGGIPYSDKSGVHAPAYMAFLGNQGESNHVVGGSYSGEVPICHICEVPAAHLLTLSAHSLPYEFSNNPSFYWYFCHCHSMDSTTVQVNPEGPTVYYGPKGQADPHASLTDGERSLLLERHPNQAGVSVRAVVGQSLHQVGGLPRWRQPTNHPRCPECHSVMAFITFMDSSRTPFEHLDFGGIIYCFWCDHCRVSSTKIQD